MIKMLECLLDLSFSPADDAGPLVPQLTYGAVPLHQQGPGISQGTVPHHGQWICKALQSWKAGAQF